MTGIVSSQEAQMLIGWGAVLGVRFSEIICGMQSGEEINPDKLMHREEVEGLFDFSKGITPAVRRTVEIVMESVVEIMDGNIKKTETQFSYVAL